MVEVKQLGAQSALDLGDPREVVQLAQNLDGVRVMVGGLGMRIAAASSIARLNRIRNGTLGIASVEKMACQLRGHRCLP